MVQTPSARSGKEYAPCRSVTALNFFSPCVAVTVAPGTGKPPNVTSPCCSEANRLNTTNPTATRERMRRRITMRVLLVVRRPFQVVDDNHFHRALSRLQLQAQLLLQ